MIVLAVETSVPNASVALWMDDAIVYQERFTSDRNHNSMIFEPIKEALAILGGRKFSHVLVGIGPGSYSGTRTGIATGQGVALAHGCPAIGIGSLAATPVARDAKAAIAIGDARRGLYYKSEITDSGEASEAELMDVEEFQRRLGEACLDEEVALFTLDDPKGAWLSGVKLPGEVMQTSPHATGIIDVWSGMTPKRRVELLEKPLSPSYLRPPFTSKAKPGHPLLRQS